MSYDVLDLLMLLWIELQRLRALLNGASPAAASVFLSCWITLADSTFGGVLRRRAAGDCI